MQVTASASGQLQGQASGTVGQDFALQIPNAHLWSPDDPFLYDLEVVLISNTGDQQVCVPCSPLSFPLSRSRFAHVQDSIHSVLLKRVNSDRVYRLLLLCFLSPLCCLPLLAVICSCTVFCSAHDRSVLNVPTLLSNGGLSLEGAGLSHLVNPIRVVMWVA